jgi:hypothetical protein
MKSRPRPHLLLLTLTLLAGGCDDPTADHITPGDADAGDAEAAGECEAEVQIGVYATDECAGEPLMVYSLAIAESCSAWDHGDRRNSATRFQCWRDRLCYTQYVSTGTCEAGATLVTDKQAMTSCEKDPTPKIYTKILGGTEDCPEPPPGFECPSSPPGEGTPGVAAACEG